MINAMEQVLQPFSIFAFIFGFGVLRYPFDHPRIRLSIFYILTMWSVYIYIIHYMIHLFSLRSIFYGILNIFIIIINIIVTIISIFTFFYKYEIFRKCLKKLSFVDNTLELLGTPKEYHKIRNSINWIFITWFVIICMTWFLDSLWLIEKYNDIRAMFIPMIKNYPLYINIFMDLMYVFLLSFIGTRLDKINGHIKELSEIEEYEIRCTWKKSLIVIRPYMRGAGNRKHVLWIAMHLHLDLCRIASEIHGLFEIHMTLQMISYFVVLITMFYFEYHTMLCLRQIYNGNTTQLKLIFSWNIWFTVCLIKIMLFNHTCENISTKAKKTKDLIHKLTNCMCFAETREEILQFVLQISLRPLKFSGLGLFYFGYKFICKFFIRILTTVIFLLQIDTPSVSQILIPDRSNTTC